MSDHKSTPLRRIENSGTSNMTHRDFFLVLLVIAIIILGFWVFALSTDSVADRLDIVSASSLL